MKILEKTTLIIYSYIILILSVLACLLVFGWIDLDVIQGAVEGIILGETSGRVVLGISIVFILLSIKCIFLIQHQKNKLKKDREFY